jgi:PBP1b-binding outer membrane lipoprotein LpoB
MKKYIISLAIIFFITGCATTPTESVTTRTTPVSSETLTNDKAAEYATAKSSPKANEILPKETNSDKYKGPSVLMSSLLKSGQSSLSEEALKMILSSRVVLPKKGHLAIMIFPGPEHTAPYNYGNNYKSSEAYLKTQSNYISSLTMQLEKSDRIIAVTLLPTLLSPNDAGIPVLREAAVRLQADLLLAFRISSDMYNQSDSNRAKAFCTIEAVLMDIRTGLIPYTTVVTRDNEQELGVDDTNINDVRIRAEKVAVLSSLTVVADEITEFLSSVP